VTRAGANRAVEWASAHGWESVAVWRNYDHVSVAEERPRLAVARPDVPAPVEQLLAPVAAPPAEEVHDVAAAAPANEVEEAAAPVAGPPADNRVYVPFARKLKNPTTKVTFSQP